MSQLDARVGREYASVRSQDRLPATPRLSERERTFGFDQNDILSPARSAERAAIGKAELRRVVLVENDQYYREVLTVELLRQGFVVHAFTDGSSLLGSLATAGDADLVVLDWDLPKMPGIKLLAELRQHGVDLPVVFLTGKVIAGVDHDRCLLPSREALNADECMAFDQGAIDFIAKSRDRQVLVRRLRSVVERAKPKTDVAVEERVLCDPRLLEPGRCRPHARGIQNRPSAGIARRLFHDLSHGLRPPDLRRLHRRDRGGWLSGERPIGDQAHPQQVPRLRPRLRRDRELHRLRILLAQAISLEKNRRVDRGTADVASLKLCALSTFADTQSRAA
jgi:DNA-binding response OmpR family regulator